MKRHGLRQIIPLLAGSLGLLLAGLAPASVPEKPRQENFPSYSLYIQALVDYQRALDAPPKEKPRESADAAKLCRDGGSDKEKKKNSCEGKYLLIEDKLLDNASREQKPPSNEVAPEQDVESLEEAISRAGYETVRSRGDGVPDFSPRGFPLQEISAQDLSESGVAGLLGLFDNVRMTNLGANAGAASGGSFGLGSGSSGNSGGDSDGSMRVTLEDFILQLSTLDLDQLAGTVSFGDGYSIVSAKVLVSGNGLSIGLSSETYTPVYIVDRDGLPGTKWDGAGAITLDRMAILIPYVEANIQSVRTNAQDSSLLQIDALSLQPIYVDFSDTRVGVAPASRDGSWIGESTEFLRFGPESMLIISGGTRVRAVVSKPNGLSTPLLTLNGRIGDISVNDIRLLDQPSGGSIGFGRFAIQGLELADTKIYMNGRSVVINTGRGFSNVGVDIERFYLGNDRGSSFIGDFYARGGNLQNLTISATPH